MKEVFHRTTSTKITTVTLNIRYPDDKIPADILSNKRTENLHLVSNDEEEHIELQVDSNAFRSTKNFTKSFLIYNFDGKNLELDFLSGFNKLRNLTFDTITNIHDCFPKLPPLPNLKILVMQYVSGLVDIQTFPHLVHGLNSVALAPHKEEEVWDNETVGSILEWLLISSAETLEYLSLEDNDYLTQVPTQISSFKALNYLRLVKNNIHTIKTGALTFSSPVITLRLFFNSFKVIQPGAFQGKYTAFSIMILFINFSSFYCEKVILKMPTLILVVTISLKLMKMYSFQYSSKWNLVQDLSKFEIVCISESFLIITSITIA